jgi:hypothetical protein
MPFTITETQDINAMKASWAQTILALQPLIDAIENPEDQAYFKGIASLLVGKDIRLANIPPRLMYIFIIKARRLYTLIYYSNIISLDYIRREVGDFITCLGLSVSEDALFIKYGIGGFQQQRQLIKQEYAGIPVTTKETTGV